MLKTGSRGAQVTALQEKLGGLKTDGIFGPLTREAVIAFQKGNGLVPDGIAGPLTLRKLGLIRDFVRPMDFKQYDSRWGSVPYTVTGDRTQTIKSSGCGPAAMADIVYSLKDSSVTPRTLAEKALIWGDRSRNNGTNWSFFSHAGREYGLKLTRCYSLEALKSCLDAGGYAVASMGKGYWTQGGHYICVWKYADGYVYANDPASSVRQKQAESAFKKERKAFFCFMK